MFLVFQFFSFLIAFKLKNSNVFIFSKPVCFLIHLKLIHRFNFNSKIISVTLQHTVFFRDRSTSHPTQPCPWPWGLWRRHSRAGRERAGRWEGFGTAGSSPSLPRPWRNNLQVSSWCAAAISLALLAVRAVGQTHPCCAQIPLSEERTWQYMFLPSPGIAVINVYISQRTLNYLLKLYMASPIWCWCQHGICLPWEPGDHSELLQEENQLISLLRSNLQQCEFCRWQPDETDADLSPLGLDAAPQASLGPGHLGQSKEDPNPPRLSL